MDRFKCYYCPEGFHSKPEALSHCVLHRPQEILKIKSFAFVGNKLGYRTLNYTVIPSEETELGNCLEINNGSVTLALSSPPAKYITYST